MIAFRHFIVVAFILFQGVWGYCIYNRLTSGTFSVSQEVFSLNIPARKTFKKVLEKGTSECCHYTNRDCSFHGGNDDKAVFYFSFDWPAYESKLFLIVCTTGGGLTVLGSEEDHHAFCKDATGSVSEVGIVHIDKKF
ncbi:hypothetical protein BD770DRAFT_401564 [Pilaira anomala]|nr:hypothetical protein BD770DRAFT_401564 [Pilaira anomala]